MDTSQKKVESGCFLIFVIIIIIALIQVKFGCGESSNTKQRDNLSNYNSLPKSIEFSSCEEEKNYLHESIKDFKSRIKELDQTYYQLKNEEMEWDKYIAEWNRYILQLADKNRDINFKCVHSYLYQNTISSLRQVGGFYASDQISKAKEFEKYFYKFSNQVLTEIK